MCRWPLCSYLRQIVPISLFLLLWLNVDCWDRVRFLYPWLLAYSFGLFEVVFTQFVSIDIELEIFELHVNLVIVELLLSQEIIFKWIFSFISGNFYLYPLGIVNVYINLWQSLLILWPSFKFLFFLLYFFISPFQ